MRLLILGLVCAVGASAYGYDLNSESNRLQRLRTELTESQNALKRRLDRVIWDSNGWRSSYSLESLRIQLDNFDTPRRLVRITEHVTAAQAKQELLASTEERIKQVETERAKVEREFTRATNSYTPNHERVAEEFEKRINTLNSQTKALEETKSALLSGEKIPLEYHKTLNFDPHNPSERAQLFKFAEETRARGHRISVAGLDEIDNANLHNLKHSIATTKSNVDLLEMKALSRARMGRSAIGLGAGLLGGAGALYLNHKYGPKIGTSSETNNENSNAVIVAPRVEDDAKGTRD